MPQRGRSKSINATFSLVGGFLGLQEMFESTTLLKGMILRAFPLDSAAQGNNVVSATQR
jgi:hypothetical protein